jgi:hypothetical protein
VASIGRHSPPLPDKRNVQAFLEAAKPPRACGGDFRERIRLGKARTLRHPVNRNVSRGRILRRLGATVTAEVRSGVGVLIRPIKTECPTSRSRCRLLALVCRSQGH